MKRTRDWDAFHVSGHTRCVFRTGRSRRNAPGTGTHSMCLGIQDACSELAGRAGHAARTFKQRKAWRHAGILWQVASRDVCRPLSF